MTTKIVFVDKNDEFVLTEINLKDLDRINKDAKVKIIVDVGLDVSSGEYLNDVLGFLDNKSGTFISDLFLSCCGRFEVNPIKEYGLTQKQVDFFKNI